jgi:2-amino-4-hydroxy-6-hydroxymethyldihydropteridine diphosphokinase
MGDPLEGILSYIGIGSNLDDPLQKCRQAVERLSHVSGIKLERISSFYKTEPVIDAEEARQTQEKQNWFINAVAEIRTILFPREVLNTLMEIEMTMGRRREFKGSPRTLDIDLLLYGQEVIEEADLTVPHPRMHERRFVLEPMCEIASYVIHPAYGVSMRGLRDRLTDQKTVERLIGREKMNL